MVGTEFASEVLTTDYPVFSFLFFSFFSLFFSLWLPLFFHFPSRPEREYET